MRDLCIQVKVSTKSFYVYRKPNGRALRFKIGSFPEMSAELARRAMRHLGDIVQDKRTRSIFAAG